MSLQLLNHAEQVAEHLRGELLRGRWSKEMPGQAKLGAELGVNHTTMGAALQLLEKERHRSLSRVGRHRPMPNSHFHGWRRRHP